MQNNNLQNAENEAFILFDYLVFGFDFIKLEEIHLNENNNGILVKNILIKYNIDIEKNNLKGIFKEYNKSQIINELNRINLIEASAVINKHIISDISFIENNITGAYNKIYFGAPGTGKSYKIKQDYSKPNGFNTVRTLFHPEYTYNDFIGYLVPKLNQNKQVEYTYIEGPFTKVLNNALNNPHEKHVLVIEEINRGNASAIFGDLFQLLDRHDNGNSEYSIFNTQILDQINNKDVHFPKNEINIPSNMWIVATANTSDQNSFVMDTAFLRRWEMERLDINFNQTDIKDWTFNENFLPCETWQQFGETINNFLEDHTEELMSEDKLLGQRFIKEKDLNKNSFINKVFRYLWEDVVKLDRTILFNENIKSFKDLANKLNENQYEIVFNQKLLNKFNEENIQNKNNTNVNDHAQ